MARGKKATQVEVVTKKLVALEAKIENKKAELSSLEEQKAQLESELKAAKLEELSSFLDEKGMSVDEIKAMIENQIEKGEGQD